MPVPSRPSLARLAAGTVVLCLIIASAPARPSPRPPPNLVTVSERVVTSGQPSPEWLESLKTQGFEAVIYLAPPTVPDAVKDEPQIVARQGLLFINIPVSFENPSERDVESFVGIMNALAQRKVLVHCQINLRASSMVFLYRVIVRKESPHVAYEAVSRVWQPNASWKRLIQSQLSNHGIEFDPF